MVDADLLSMIGLVILLSVGIFVSVIVVLAMMYEYLYVRRHNKKYTTNNPTWGNVSLTP